MLVGQDAQAARGGLAPAVISREDPAAVPVPGDPDPQAATLGTERDVPSDVVILVNTSQDRSRAGVQIQLTVPPRQTNQLGKVGVVNSIDSWHNAAAPAGRSTENSSSASSATNVMVTDDPAGDCVGPSTGTCGRVCSIPTTSDTNCGVGVPAGTGGRCPGRAR